jgi:8-amino-7-oxononanoate synthase
MIDDAHGLGVLGASGQGVFEHFGVDPRRVDIWMGTLSKTLAACGGFIAGPETLVDYLKRAAGGFVYSVAMPPAIAAAALAALELLATEPQRVARLRANARRFHEAARAADLDTGLSAGEAIAPIVTGSSLRAVALSQRLFDRGVNVQPIIRPAIPERLGRLRFFISADHTFEQIDAAIRLLGEQLRDLGSTVSSAIARADVR